MNARAKLSLIEWLFVVAMLILCGVLGILQYHWTGEIARAEAERLSGNIERQSWQFCRQFDDEVAEVCDQLRLSPLDVELPDRVNAYEARLKSWLLTNPPPLFSRIAVAIERNDDLDIYHAQLDSGTFNQGVWPSQWETLHQNILSKRKRGAPPFEDRNGLLWEIPVRGSEKMSWIILELNLRYLQSTWLPDLVTHHFNFGQMPLYEVTVRSGNQIIYSTPERVTESSEQPNVMGFNIQGQTFNVKGPPHRPLWLLEVRRLPGALDKMVSDSRSKNMIIALILNALIFAVGLGLLRHTRRSRQLAESQMNFVASVSHELRTPLTVIRGAAHNLKNGVVSHPEKRNRYTSLILQHTEDLQEMVEQVLELAGAKSSARSSSHIPLRVDDLLRDSITATMSEATEAGSTVETAIEANLPMIKGDPAALRRVFQNLIANAIKHAGSGEWVGVKAVTNKKDEATTVDISVSDRGPGIPIQEQGEIFEPFVRGSGAQSLQTRGSGIGLTLVREIVENHSGKVMVKSEPGAGATFIIQFPAI